MSKKQVKVHVLLEHHTEDEDAKVLGVYVTRKDALKAKDRYMYTRVKPTQLSQRKPKLGYLAVLKMTLKGMYIRYD